MTLAGSTVRVRESTDSGYPEYYTSCKITDLIFRNTYEASMAHCYMERRSICWGPLENPQQIIFRRCKERVPDGDGEWD